MSIGKCYTCRILALSLNGSIYPAVTLFPATFGDESAFRDSPAPAKIRNGSDRLKDSSNGLYSFHLCGSGLRLHFRCEANIALMVAALYVYIPIEGYALDETED
jgi:hypothetical protein